MPVIIIYFHFIIFKSINRVEIMDKNRRRFIKIGIGVAILFAGYLAWRQMNIPEIKEPSNQVGGNTTSGIGEKPQELNIEFEEYPTDSPLNHTSPYLVLEPISSYNGPGGATLILNCHNRGGGVSTAVLEVFRLMMRRH